MKRQGGGDALRCMAWERSMERRCTAPQVVQTTVSSLASVVVHAHRCTFRHGCTGMAAWGRHPCTRNAAQACPQLTGGPTHPSCNLCQQEPRCASNPWQAHLRSQKGSYIVNRPPHLWHVTELCGHRSRWIRSVQGVVGRRLSWAGLWHHHLTWAAAALLPLHLHALASPFTSHRS